MKKFFWCVVLVCLFWGPQAAMGEEAINACGLVSHEAAEKVAGVKLAPGQLTEFDMPIMRNTTLCHYESLDSKHHRRFVNIELTRAESGEEAGEKFRDALDLMSSPQHVSGLGDEAAWGGDISRPRGGMVVRQGRYMLEVKVGGGSDRANRNMAEKLAGQALEKLAP